MADVDQCTRYAEEGLCKDAKSNALKIVAIPNELRNVIFRNRNAAQIEKMLDKFSRTIRESVSAKYGFTCDSLEPSSNNNKDGADLYCINPKTKERITIEVKFGSYTDKAAGMGSFAKIFGTDVFTKTLSTDARKQWITLVADEYPDLSKQSRRLSVALDQAVDIFNAKMLAKEYKLTRSEQAFMEDYLLNNSGSYESKSDNYMRFETKKNSSKIIEAMPVVKGLGEWIVDKVKPVDVIDDKSRVTVFVTNSKTGVKIRFVLNNKNNFEIKGTNIEVPSKYMINSPSWNVWIGRKNDI